MCGIVGIVSKAQVPQPRLEAARDLLVHRGPDDAGTWRTSLGDWSVAFGHRRLSIIDLSPLGHQPMVAGDGVSAIVFNGEIYNFVELRRILRNRGVSLKSTSDTDVLLEGLGCFGLSWVDRLVGMFSLAYWDGRRGQLWLARDRLGEKPLYYFHNRTTGDIGFASEPKALICLLDEDPTLDRGALAKYLTYLWVPDPLTLFTNIFKLPPANVAIWEDGQLVTREYWDLEPQAAGTMQDEARATHELGERFRAAVQERLIADVPLGAFLSGGLDSSAIVAVMAGLSDRKVVTESIGFTRDDQRLEVGPDDLRYARMVNAFLPSRLDYQEHLLTVDAAELLPRLVGHFDDLVADPAALATYVISRAAKPRATVLLIGTGAEECFAGYPRYWAALAAQRYVSLVPALLRAGLAGTVAAIIPASRGGFLMPRFRHIRKFFAAADHPLPARFLGFRSYYDPKRLGELLGSPVQCESLHQEHLEYWKRVEGLDPLSQMLYLDIKTYLPCLNLAYADRASMACSVELRAPFLDHKLVELAWAIDTRLKLRGRTPKYILRKALAPYLPRTIVTRPKAGFGGPVRSWIRGPLSEYVRDRLSAPAVRKRGLVSAEAVQRIIREERSGEQDNALKIWALLLLELWCERFLDDARAWRG